VSAPVCSVLLFAIVMQFPNVPFRSCHSRTFSGLGRRIEKLHRLRKRFDEVVQQVIDIERLSSIEIDCLEKQLHSSKDEVFTVQQKFVSLSLDVQLFKQQTRRLH